MVFRVFRMKCSFFLVLFAMASGTEESSDTDDDALQQALFLVNVLKSDYAKLLLRQNMEAKTENPSTCPLTTENSTSLVSETTTTPTTPEINTSTPPPSSKSLPASFVDTTLLSPSTTELPRSDYLTSTESADNLDYPEDYPLYDLPSRRKFNNIKRIRNNAPMNRRGHQNSSSQKAELTPAERLFLKNRQFRRMGPVDINLNSSSPSSLPPKIMSTTTPVPTTESKKSTPLGIDLNSSSPSSLPPKIMSTTTPVPTTESKKSTPLGIEPTTLAQLKSTKAVSNSNSSSVSKAASNFSKPLPRKMWKNYAFPHIARELFNELKGGGLTLEPPTKIKAQRLRPKLRNKLKGRSGTTKKQSDIAKEQSEILKSYTRKGTLKIHNARSTPLSFPLSENHAYCYFSPKSPLCGTWI